MNAGQSNTGTGAGGMLNRVLGIVVFIGVVVALYYLYQFLYGKAAGSADVSLLDGSKSMTAVVPNEKFVATTLLTGVLDGGQYTVNFWAYVADARNMNSGKLAHLLEISKNRFVTSGTKGNTLLFVGINPRNGTLVVRQNTDGDVKIDNSLDSESQSAYTLDNLINGYNGSSMDNYQKNDDRCDLINGIEYQRWVMITCVANGRTLDVYLDGKLARSCVYKGNYALGSTDGSAAAVFGHNNDGNLKGFFSNGRYYNYALTPDAIWSLYQGGPSGYFNIGSFFKNLFNIDVSFEKTANLNP